VVQIEWINKDKNINRSKNRLIYLNQQYLICLHLFYLRHLRAITLSRIKSLFASFPFFQQFYNLTESMI